MITKYDTEIDNRIIENNIKRLINQTYKLLPNREEGVDWIAPLGTITEEIAGMGELFNAEIGSQSLALLAKLEGLSTLVEEKDFRDFRRVIFECLNLMNEVKAYVSVR